MPGERKKRSSLRSIAQEVGLSATTVYQILNNKANDRISEETRQKVLRTAEAMGYRPNIGYKLMRGEKTRIVAILISSEQLRCREYISRMIISLVNALNAQGYGTYLNVMEYSAENNLNRVRELHARGAEHFIVLGNMVGFDLVEEEIEKTRCSLIGYCDSLKRRISNELVPAQAEILRLFQSRNHRNIKCVVPDTAVYTMYGRLDALKAVYPELSKNELVSKYIFSFPGQSYPDPSVMLAKEFESGFHVTEKLMQDFPETDAIFFHNDNSALGGVKYLTQNGYTVGKDVLVAGFFNTTAAQFSCYPVSSIAYDIEQVQKLLLENAFSTEKCEVKVPCITHIREL